MEKTHTSQLVQDFPEFDDKQLEYLIARYKPSFDVSDSPDTQRWKAAQYALVEEIVATQNYYNLEREQGIREGNSPVKIYDKN